MRTKKTQKFQSLFINPRNIAAMNSDRALNIDNQKIKKTEQIKLLGSYINEYLNFTGHISNLCTKSNQKVGVLVYGCNVIPCNTKLTLYKSAILSHLTYWPLYGIFASHTIVGRLCRYRRVHYMQYINQRWKHTKNSSLMLGTDSKQQTPTTYCHSDV